MSGAGRGRFPYRQHSPPPAGPGSHRKGASPPSGAGRPGPEHRCDPQYFCELFKSVTTQRPVEYINQRRIDRAKERLLKEPHARIHDIAAGVGFESDSYFGTVFKRFEGISPREYRETNGAS
ncbi:helix-turn-helix transcriptional regulator [Salinispira pacifica]|uniref:helix-turn-helix transcriptional regulator n=1 Tax=Salinispira pacifica TaxID=1307761 RepID=UPI0009DEBE48